MDVGVTYLHSILAETEQIPPRTSLQQKYLLGCRRPRFGHSEEEKMIQELVTDLRLFDQKVGFLADAEVVVADDRAELPFLRSTVKHVWLQANAHAALSWAASAAIWRRS